MRECAAQAAVGERRRVSSKADVARRQAAVDLLDRVWGVYRKVTWCVPQDAGSPRTPGAFARLALRHESNVDLADVAARSIPPRAHVQENVLVVAGGDDERPVADEALCVARLVA